MFFFSVLLSFAWFRLGIFHGEMLKNRISYLMPEKLIVSDFTIPSTMLLFNFLSVKIYKVSFVFLVLFNMNAILEFFSYHYCFMI